MFNGNANPLDAGNGVTTHYRNGVEHYAYNDGARRYVTYDTDGTPRPYSFLGDGYGNEYDEDAPSTGLTVIRLTTWQNLLGYPMVNSDTLELSGDSERDGGDAVSDALDNMSEYDCIQTPEHLQRVFQRWAARGIQITALDANHLSGGPLDPCHALPRDAYLLVGDAGGRAVAETVRQWAAGDVFRVWSPTAEELDVMTADGLYLDDMTETDLYAYVGDCVGGVYFSGGYATADEVREVI